METEILQKKKIKVVPKLRFREFEDLWIGRNLGETCEIKTGGRDTQNRVENGTYPFFVRSNTVERINSYSFDGEAILTSGDGVGVGKNFHYINGKFDYHQRVYALKNFNSGFSGRFIFHVFQKKFFKRVMRLSAKNSVDSIRMNMIADMPIFFPTLPEQQKIATFLSAVDKKVQQLSRKKEMLETYKKGVMQQLFSQEIRFKDKNGKNFPEWENKKYGDIYKFLSTNSFSRNDLNYEEGSVKNIHYGDIHTKFPNLFYLTKENVPFINQEINISRIPTENFCQEGDLVIADASEDYKDIGKTIEIIDLNGEKVLAGLHTFLARPDRNLMHTGFSGYLVQTWEFRKQVMTIAQGTKVLGLSTGRMKKLKLEIPSIPEQKKIANFLSAIDKIIDAVSQQIEKTQSFKKGLLQQMFV